MHHLTAAAADNANGPPAIILDGTNNWEVIPTFRGRKKRNTPTVMNNTGMPAGIVVYQADRQGLIVIDLTVVQHRWVTRTAHLRECQIQRRGLCTHTLTQNGDILQPKK